MKKTGIINDGPERINSSNQFHILFEAYVKTVRAKVKRAQLQFEKRTIK